MENRPPGKLHARWLTLSEPPLDVLAVMRAVVALHDKPSWSHAVMVIMADVVSASPVSERRCSQAPWGS